MHKRVGKKRSQFAVQVGATKQILAPEDVAGEAEVQGLGFVVVTGSESGRWRRRRRQGEEIGSIDGSVLSSYLFSFSFLSLMV